jgi:hypothetical protein
MHIIADKNHAVVEQMAAWLESMDLPPQWAVAMVQDFERGEALRLEKAIRDQWAVSATNDQAEHRGVECLGQVELQMASSLRSEIYRRYADKGVLDDPRYLKKLEQDHGFRFKPRYQRKAQVVVERRLSA